MLFYKRLEVLLEMFCYTLVQALYIQNIEILFILQIISSKKWFHCKIDGDVRAAVTEIYFALFEDYSVVSEIVD